jgi:D-hexose-6-phosphate mutarotase
MSVQALNAKFGLGAPLRFVEDPDSGLVVAEIDNPLSIARICLQGAHLLTWRPRTSSIPVVWLSDAAQLTPGKSPHSGAPVCWPWFGNHESESGYPAHGFARNAPWEVIATSHDSDGATRITLRLIETGKSRAFWPASSTLELAISVGTRLSMALTTTNSGSVDIVIGEAFHTYFQVGDIAQARVIGLENTVYADKVENFARSKQEGTITFAGETDRVYLDTSAECIIEDPVLQRRIHVAKSGSRSTVVWTPWQEKGDKMGDLGTDGWRHMLCVESANAMENRVAIKAGESHTLAVEYSVEPF